MFASLRRRNEAIVDSLDEAGTYPKWVLLTALAGMFATTFPITVLTVAIPDMARDFGVSTTTLAWVVTLPTLLSALALPVFGKLGDLYGHRRVFLIGFVLATLSTALTATASSAFLLIMWRTLTQVTGAATQPSSLALINTEHGPLERPRAMGWWAMVAAGAPVIGLTVGGPMIDVFGWKTLFLIQAVFMVVPVVASALVLRETETKQARFDVPGSLTLMVGVGALMVFVSQIDNLGLLHPAILLSLVLAPLGLYAFTRIERASESPLLPLEFFGRRDFTASVLVSLFSSGAYMGGYFIATLLMTDGFGYTAAAASLYLITRPAVFAIMSPVGGRVTERRGNRFSAVSGSVLLTAGLSSLAIGAATETLPVVLVGFVLQGCGYGLLRPPISTALANSVTETDLGIAAAAERLFGQVGMSFGITVLAAAYGGHSEPERFALAFAIGAGLSVVSVVGCLFLRPQIQAAPIDLGDPALAPHAS